MATTQPTPRVRLPRVLFGASALGNLYESLSDQRKLEIVRAWIAQGEGPIVVDCAGKYGAGLALETLGDCLRQLGATPEEVTIGVKLGWKRIPLIGAEPMFEPGVWVDLKHDAEQHISAAGILDCWRQALELLGEPYRPRMISVHDPDEYLHAATGSADLARRRNDLMEAYQELQRLRAVEPACTLGVGSKDWRIAQMVASAIDLDWVMLANCVTIYTHPPEALAFIESLSQRGVAVINSGVFNAGFLVGGAFFDYRTPSPIDDAALYRWRDRFRELCNRHGVSQAHACIQFGLSPAGVGSIALNSTNPERVQQNSDYAARPIPDEFWRDAKEQGIVSPSYPYLGTATG